MSRRGAAALAVVAALALLAGCGRAAAEAPLRFFAAASTNDFAIAAAGAFERATGREVECHVAASSTLARQIEEGARADVVLLADVAWMDHLEARGEIDAATRAPLLANGLVAIVPRDAPAPADFTEASRIAVGDPEHVPVGRYARQALERTGAWERVAPRILPTVDAPAALRLVEQGHAPAGIVYASDARRSRHVVLVHEFPADTHDPIVYPVAAVTGAQDGTAAFLAFLAAPETRQLAESLGLATSLPDGTAARAGATVTPAPEAPLLWSALRLSVIVAIVGVALSAIPGIACGWLLARKRFPGRALLDAIVHLPLVLPPVVTGYLLLLALGPNGIVGGWLERTLGLRIAFTTTGAAVAAAVMGFPLLVRGVRLGVELVDPRLEEAARTLGASPWRVLLTVTLPLAVPGVLTGLVLAFARGLGEFGATITFAGNIEGATRTIPLAVFNAMQTPGGSAVAAKLAVLSIVLSLGALLVSEALSRRTARRRGAP